MGIRQTLGRKVLLGRQVVGREIKPITSIQGILRYQSTLGGGLHCLLFVHVTTDSGLDVSGHIDLAQRWGCFICQIPIGTIFHLYQYFAALTWHIGVSQREEGLELDFYFFVQVPGGPTLSEVHQRLKSHASAGQEHKVR